MALARFCLIGLFTVAFLVQGVLQQSHWHDGPADAARDPGCPVCQDLALNGVTLVPAAPILLPAADLVPLRFLLATVTSEPGQAVFGPQPRAPPVPVLHRVL